MQTPDPFSVASLDTIPKDRPLDLKALNNVERAQAIEELNNIRSIAFFHDGISIAFLDHIISTLQYYQLQKAT